MSEERHDGMESPKETEIKGLLGKKVTDVSNNALTFEGDQVLSITLSEGVHPNNPQDVMGKALEEYAPHTTYIRLAFEGNKSLQIEI